MTRPLFALFGSFCSVDGTVLHVAVALRRRPSDVSVLRRFLVFVRYAIHARAASTILESQLCKDEKAKPFQDGRNCPKPVGVVHRGIPQNLGSIIRQAAVVRWGDAEVV